MITDKVICAKCKLEKTRDDFYIDRNKKNGLGSHCKKCVGSRKSHTYKNKRRIKKQREIKTQKGSLVIPENLKKFDYFVSRDSSEQLSFFDILKEVL